MSLQKVVYGFIPTSITGCALWLDASDTTTISRNSSSSVLQWRDKSGNGLSAVYDSVTGYTLPTYVSNGATKYVSLQLGQGLYIPIFHIIQHGLFFLVCLMSLLVIVGTSLPIRMYKLL